MKSEGHWSGSEGILLQILIVLFPSALLLKAGVLLLAGLTLSTLLAWRMLQLQSLTWKNVGFSIPENRINMTVKVLISLILLFPFSYFSRKWITAWLNIEPNLDNFKVVEGNFSGLILGLIVAWIFGAFMEEFLFRGFLLNAFQKLFKNYKLSSNVSWIFAIIITSAFTGIGHAYQGVTGMLVAGLIAIMYSITYLITKKNLWSSILTHGIYDTVALSLVYWGIHL